ncbi:MAG: tripartite tricarboxylate transporter TctB family protein [Pirellulaceae bacterium]
MKQTQPRTLRRGSFGLALMLVSVFFLFFAKDIGRSGLTADNDPGPRALPMAISLLLLAGGMWELAADLRCRFRPVSTPPTDDRLIPEQAPSRGGLANVLFLVVALLLFLLLVHCVGFLWSTSLFALCMTWWLGARWWHALIFSAALVLVIDILFVHMFEVALPSGWFGFVV